MSDTQVTALPSVRDVARAAPRQGLALLVIATAQLMVVLDSTVTNVALPRIQDALHFSGANLAWVVNAYALAFGGLLLLGGRASDLLGRRRMFVIGLLAFSAASLAGGFATSQGWLLAARAVQGAGGAIVAPAALSLIVTTFPEGRPRARAMGVYSAMSVAGAAIGLVAGGLLVNYASWRWVLFVNVPFGVAAALAAPLVLAGAPRLAGRLDIPGALTGTAGVSALVYGLSSAATGPDGVSHWGDAKVVIALAAGAVLLAAFGLVEARSPHALLPGRLLRDRRRLGANLVMLGLGTELFGVFFFLTLFAQEIWGYSAIRTGVAFLPLAAAVLVGSAIASALVQRVGTRPLLLTGAAGAAGGLYWLSLMTERRRLRGRNARPSPGHRRRTGPAVRAPAADRARRHRRRGLRGGREHAHRRPADRRRRRARRTEHGRLDRGRRLHPRQPIGTRWSPASTGPSPSAPGSRWSPCSWRSP